MELDISDDIILSPIGLEHLDEYRSLVIKNQSQLRQYFNWVDHMINENKFEDFIKEAQKKIQDLKGLSWVISFQKKIIGSFTLYDWTHDVNKISIGFWLDSDHQKKGIISRCIPFVFDYLFKDLNVLKVDMYFSPKNSASKRIAEKYAFTIEGLIRQSFLINGIREDQYIAGLLQQEWFKQSHNH